MTRPEQTGSRGYETRPDGSQVADFMLDGPGVTMGAMGVAAGKRHDSWIETYTGKRFWPLEPDPSLVDIEDIAHALSIVNRFNGHAVAPYSVAQHSILCSQVAPPHLKLQALMHDAAEAYISDVTRPVKRFMPEFRQIEDNLWKNGIAPRFQLSESLDPEVVAIDTNILLTEARDLRLPLTFEWWSGTASPYSMKIEPWPWQTAKLHFLDSFHQLS